MKQIKRLLLASCIVAGALIFTSPINAADCKSQVHQLEKSEEDGLDIGLTYRMQKQVKKLCKKYQISYELTLAIIKTESEFDINAVGDGGQAIGPCQIWPKWWQDTADRNNLDIKDPVDNVELMLVILQDLLIKTNGDLGQALQYYNTGQYSGNEYASRVYVNLTYIEDLETR